MCVCDTDLCSARPLKTREGVSKGFAYPKDKHFHACSNDTRIAYPKDTSSHAYPKDMSSHAYPRDTHSHAYPKNTCSLSLERELEKERL